MTRARLHLAPAILIALAACNAPPTAPSAAQAAPRVAGETPHSAARERAVAAWDSLRMLAETPLIVVGGVILHDDELARIARADITALEFVHGTCCLGPCTPRPIAMVTLRRSAPTGAR